MLGVCLQVLKRETLEMVRGSNPSKVQEWTERLARFRNSKMSVAQFCDAEGVSSPSFYQWQRKLRKRSVSAGSVKDPAASSTDGPGAFQAVQVTPSQPLMAARDLAATPPAFTRPVLTVWLPGGIQVTVADNLPVIGAVMRELAGRHAIRGDDTESESPAC
jgi:hypothetical protein